MRAAAAPPHSRSRPAAPPRAPGAAAERRHRAQRAPDGSQILDKLVGDEERLAVEAFDQLAQPVDLVAVNRNRIVGASVIKKAVGKLRQFASRDQRRGGLDRAPRDHGEQLPRHRPVGRHHGVRQFKARHDDVERRQVGHVGVGDRHRDGAEVGGDPRFRPGRAAHSRPNGSRGRKCRFRQGTKARPHSAPSVMMAAGMKRSWLEFGRGVPVKPQRVRNRPAI